MTGVFSKRRLGGIRLRNGMCGTASDGWFATIMACGMQGKNMFLHFESVIPCPGK